jgi:HTH-type transcriptional regulator/antitoxin HigA
MSTKIKVINTKQDYEEALELVGELMDKDPSPDSEDGEKLNLLATLIHDYESRMIPNSLPDPIDAILFRMEQQNLKPNDLVPYLGSRSKVSEILSRKRALTLSMIRALETGLGIPAKVLVKKSNDFKDEEFDWNRFPLREMEKRGYINKKLSTKIDIKQLIENFLSPIGTQAQLSVMLRKSNYRSARPVNRYALLAWATFIVKEAKKTKGLAKFNHRNINLELMQKVVQLSKKKDGPLLARALLKNYGIAVIIEPHFPQTYLDGATLFLDKEHPIIGLTLRYDRLDNFWFTLMHELAHLSLHYHKNLNFFFDDLDSMDTNEHEHEADHLAQETLIPESKWESSPARIIPSPIAAESLANELGIHPAIVAGKMRRVGGKYIYLTNIINQAKARVYFPEKKWDK